MQQPLSSSSMRVQAALNQHGLEVVVLELSESTRTAKDAAKAIGCDVAQIAKTIIFRGARSQDPICVVASGINRIDEGKVAALAQEPLEKADADFVLRRTGYAIGGVPPLGHAEKIRTYIDEDLQRYQEIWAAAGTPRSVFKLTPRDLVHITQGQVVAVR